MTRTCIVCNTETSKTCTGCKFAAYCSKECQRKNWILHIVECDHPPREITTADRLAAGLLGPDFITHKQTLLDYGFLQANRSGDQEHLKAMYIELLRDLNVKPSALHKWRVERRLHEGLIIAFREARGRANQDTLEWLCRHPDIFDPDFKYRDALHDAHVQERVAWAYIGKPRTDTIEDMLRARSYWDVPRNFCFLFYVALITASPCLSLGDPWVVFGYCIFLDEEDPMVAHLNSLYRNLIDQVTFVEFHDAYLSSSILELMDMKGLADARDRLPSEFTALMQQSPRIPAVYNVKVYSLSPIFPVDYRPLIPFGFINCQDDAEHNRLRLLYAKAFKEWGVSAIPLQEAAIDNKTYSYISGCPGFKANKTERQFLRRILVRDSSVMVPERLEALRARCSPEFRDPE
ncbi:hypothetical protein SISSUDRAFT_916495 [Sistotremastrum suecicum HHB10207 ss-3]|uniref:MYND-type domain-containing protein n=1 Tax=Sistotremastrum suecicum HHB10207 ss-3 TaxID=1314776 RepID=A0A166BXM7_9AGAM|nr:hypothetical protein SISSUDRAFT_916495 [Sistotremastrum suecicum HHB10207 ss-3]